MEYRKLGNLNVSAIGMGTLRTFDVTSEKDIAVRQEIVDICIANQVNFIDTAAWYGNAEKVVGMTNQEDEQDVFRCEQRRFEAMVQGDLATLDELLADDVTYAHSTGRLDSKAQFLDSLARRYRFESITSDEVRVRIYGAVGIGTGTGQMRVKVQGQPVSFRFRFTIVYHKANDRWQVVALQHTRLSEG